MEFAYSDRDQVTEERRYSDAAGTTLVGKTTTSYFDNGNVNTITHKDASNATIDSFAYTYDDANRVTGMTSTLAPTRTYTYDAGGGIGVGSRYRAYALNLARALR